MKKKDWFTALLDVEDYIAKSGYFSSDRTTEQYNEDIWKLK